MYNVKPIGTYTNIPHFVQKLQLFWDDFPYEIIKV